MAISGTPAWSDRGSQNMAKIYITAGYLFYLARDKIG
jgi:hypothetical protein